MGDKLLIKLFAVLVLWIQSVLLLFPNVLQRALVVAALAHMDELVTRRLRWLHGLLHHWLFGQAHVLDFHLLLCVSDPAGLHHAGLIHEAALTGVEAYARITPDSGQATTSGVL